jgi:hypothetical protein
VAKVAKTMTKEQLQSQDLTGTSRVGAVQSSDWCDYTSADDLDLMARAYKWWPTTHHASFYRFSHPGHDGHLATKINIVVSSAPPLIMRCGYSFINLPNIGCKWSFSKPTATATHTSSLTQDTCDQRHATNLRIGLGRDVSHTFLATPLADGTIQVRAITKLTTPMYNIKPATKPAKGEARVAMGTWPGEKMNPTPTS